MAGQVVVELTARDKVTPVLDKVAASAEKLNKKLAPMPTAFQNIGTAGKNAFQSLNKSLNSVSGALARVGTALVVKGFVQAGVEADRAARRLKVLGHEYGEVGELEELAARSAKKFVMGQTEAGNALANLYGHLRPAGVALKDIETVFLGVEVASAKFGLSAHETNAVLMQLSQGLGLGVLNGQNYQSVMRKLPGLTDEIAKSMGVQVGQLEKLSSEGKVTTKVVIDGLQALAKQDPPNADAFRLYSKAIKDFSTAIGSELLPAVTPIIKVATELINLFGKLPGPVKTTIAAVAGVSAGIVVLTPAIGALIVGVKGIMALKLAATIAGWLGAVGPIVAAFKGLGAVLLGVFAGPVGWIALLAGAGVAIYALRDKIGNALSGVGKFFQNGLARIGLMKPAIDKTAQEMGKIPAAAKKIAPEIDKATQAKERQIEFLKKALTLHAEEKSKIKEQQAAYQNSLNVTNARLDAEQSINSLQGQVLERAYEHAGTAFQRLQIAKQIFQNELAGARIAYKQALASIEAEKTKLKMKRDGLIIDGKALEARGRLAVLEAKGPEATAKANKALGKALATQKQAVRLMDGQIVAQGEIAIHQKASAKAQFKAAELTARQNLEQKLVSDEINMSRRQAVKLSGRLADSNKSSNSLATGTGRVATNAGKSADSFVRVATNAETAAQAIHKAAEAQERLNRANSGAKSGGGGKKSTSVSGAAEGAYWSGGFKAFAQGGIVTKPTLGLVGEGGEDEYIIPQSKMGTASANYLSGGRGAGILEGGGDSNRAPNINIQTGPVMQQGGETYLTMAQFEAGLRNLSESVARNGRSYGSRHYQGVS